VTRQSMGLESASTISATFGNLHKVEGTGYLRALSEVLQRFPKHFHVFAGAGNVRAIRSHLHSEGVLSRVRFLGQLSDVAPLLPMTDIYLASFPDSDATSVLEAMGAGKPVVALKLPSNSHHNSGAELVEVRELMAPGEADYIEIADKLLRTPAFRLAQGQAMLDRFHAEFRPERLGERYKAFIERFWGAGPQ
jgi:glycosyltransferase involved in cell wall biosynthesis